MTRLFCLMFCASLLTQPAAVLAEQDTSQNIYPDGELLVGEFSIFPEQPEGTIFTVEMFDGSPLGDASPINGDRCQKIVCDEQDSSVKPRNMLRMTTGTILVDPTKTYRIAIRAYIPDKGRVIAATYAFDKKNKLLKNEQDRVWSWTLIMKGPTEGFETFETTLGPAGSGAEHEFLPGTLKLQSLGVRLYEEVNTFYVDDVIVQESAIDGAEPEDSDPESEPLNEPS